MALEPSQILISLGPTLSVTQASQILPACYLAPVRCGDVLACLRLQPRVIAIIDGFFDRSASVWHKEILWAIAAGVRVFGASSMGALRAAELEAFGMQGFGAIFTAYREGEYIGDDEVAVLHSNATSQYQPLTDALVNIRATVNHAVSQNILDPAIANLIISCAKRQFFSQRHLRQAVVDAEAQGGDAKVLAHFWEFVQNGGYVDQKQLDAIGLLKHLATMVGESSEKNQVQFQLNKSIFIEELQARVAIRPMPTAYSWLPLTEKVCQEARFLGRVYIQLRNLAGLLRWCDAIAQSQNLPPLAVNLAEVNVTSDELEPTLVQRWGRIQALLKIYSEHDGFQQQVEQLHGFILTMVSKNLSVAEGENQTESVLASCERRLYRLIATLWALAEQTHTQSDVNLRTSITQKITQHFLLQRGVTNEPEVEIWLKENGLIPSEFMQMMAAIARLEGFVNVPRWWGRGMSQYFSINECFLADALKLSGFYSILSKIVQSDSQLQHDPGETELRNWYQLNAFSQVCNSTQVAFWLDFSEPEEFVKELQTRN
ncbi:TfuA-like protein [Anabaena sp. UHCC 0399]|uniref:TfuA-like protein n=1 Tax=Anabaena sp. UHCC 0399 TaxID=3110238 RepID=UPI002B21D87B|nr:TfuA-like protein [Anabaena sp. UHCC 0399]MEA5568493.1 TfuA-like protein [Anabaena sp. UHCC 0399]